MLVGIAIVFMTFGGFMVYSAIAGKGIDPPNPDALLQLRIQYKMRGLIGTALIVIGGLIFAGIIKVY